MYCSYPALFDFLFGKDGKDREGNPFEKLFLLFAAVLVLFAEEESLEERVSTVCISTNGFIEPSKLENRSAWLNTSWIL